MAYRCCKHCTHPPDERRDDHVGPCPEGCNQGDSPDTSGETGRKAPQQGQRTPRRPARRQRHRALATRCVIRHSRSTAETFELFAMLGVSAPPERRPEPGPRVAPMLAHAPARATAGKRRKA